MTGIALLSVIALWSVSWTGTSASEMLPSIVIPEVYNIHLEPNLANDEFTGNVTVKIFVKNETSVIAFHQQDLKITLISIGNGIIIEEKRYDKESEIMTIYLNQQLTPFEKYYINFVYSGTMRNDRYGLYKSNYTDGEGTKWMVMTHLEPTGARLVFPCWDEPRFKAAFEISITHFKNHKTVLSNMPISSRTDNGETFTTHFDRSMKMSTYLVAFVISDYDYKPQSDDRIRIYTKPNAVNYTDYAWKFTVRAMKLLDDYTEISYFKYMPKYDQISAIELDPLAMENWGLVTFREDSFLYEEGISTSTQKEMISRTIAHELAHQWFGNLVSPIWWDYLWLNEGFANYFESYVIDKLEPSWRVMDMFPVKTIQQSLFLLDLGARSYPMDKHVEDENDIWSKFTFISYKKAGTVIRMFSQILTEEVLHEGLKTYLYHYKLGNANSSNLLNHLSEAHGPEPIYSGVHFPEIARSWINQSEYPVVNVTKLCPGVYLLSQKRSTEYEIYHNDTKWWVPITYATNHKLNFTDISVTHWLPKTGDDIIISEPDADWILVNKQQMGYYRVNYDEETWHNLSNFLQTNMHKIHPINRAQMIDDVFTMAVENTTKYETALYLTLYLTQEIDYVPWMAAFKHLKLLRDKLFHDYHYETFKRYIRFIMRSLTTHVRYEVSPNDDHATKILRAKAMHWGCLADVKECVDSAQKYFNEWLNDPKHRIDPDLRGAILCTGLRTASQEVWDQARQILETVKFKTGSNEDNPLEALSCSNNREILKKFLINSAATDANIEFLEAARLVIANTNVSGVDVVQDVLDLHFEKNFVKKDDFMVNVAPVTVHIVPAIVNKDQYERLNIFRTRIGANQHSTAKVLNKARIHLMWITQYADKVDKWLLANEEVFISSAPIVFTSFLWIFSIFITRYV